MFRYPLFKQITTPRMRKTTDRRRKLPARPRAFRPSLEQLESLTLPSITWIGGAGDWDTAANWSTGLVPGGGDDVVINSGSPTHGLTTADAVRSITNSAPIAIAAGTLTVGSGTSSINAALTVSSGATLTLNSSTLNGSGTVTNSGTMNVTSCTLAAALVNQGTLMNFASDTFNGSLSNAAGAMLWVQGNNSTDTATLTSANGFTNDGTLRLETVSGTWSEILTISSGTLTNAADGTLLFNLGTGGGRVLSGSLTNQGTISVTAVATFNGSVANSGQISVDSAASLVIQNATYTAAGGTITGPAVLNNDTIQETASPPTPSTMVLVNAATLTTDNLANYTLWVQGGADNGAFGPASLTSANSFTNHGTLRLETVSSTWSETLTISSGTLTNAADGTLLFNLGTGGGRVLSGKLTNQGTITATAGTTFNGNLVNQSQISVGSNASLVIQNATYTAAGGTITGPGFLLNETLQETAAPAAPSTIVLIGDTTLTTDNLANYTLWVQGGGDGTGPATLTSANSFTNHGTIQLETVSSTWSETLTVSSGTLTNAADGTIQVNPGTGGGRVLSGSLTNQGIVTVGAGITLPENGSNPVFTQASGTFTVDPTSFFYVNGGSINFSGGAISGPVLGDSSTLSVTAGVTTPSTVFMSSGTLVNNLSPVVTVWVQGGGLNGGFGPSNVVLAANATNVGTIHLETDNGTSGATLNTNGFTLTNSGTLSVSLGTGGGRGFTGNLVNSGQVNVDNNTSMFIQGGTYTAAGGTITGPAFVLNDTLRVTASPPTPSTIVLVGSTTLTTGNFANYTLWVQGGGNGTGPATLTSASSFTNHGTLRLETASSTWSETLTISSGTLTNASDGTILVNPGTGGGRTITGTLTNLGTIMVSTGATLVLNGGTLTNLSGGTLTGGTYNISGTFQFPNAAITTNAATIVLNGASSQIIDQSSNNALANFGSNAAAGSFTIQNARNFTASGSFSNAGSVTVGTGSTLSASSGQYASTVIGFSSQYSSGGWSAAQALGAPNVTSYSDNPAAWAPSSENGTHEYLTLGFAAPVSANGVVIRETYGNGFVPQVDLLDTNNVYHTVFTGPDPSQPGSPVNFLVSFPATTYLVQGVKVYVDTNHNLSAYEEIDAVQLLSASAYLQTAGSTTLSGGTLTVPNQVAINAGSLNGSGTINGNVSNAGQVNPGGAGAAGLLTINGNYTQTVAGALNIELGGLTAGSQFDQLAVSGVATLGGTLNVSLISAFLPAIPNSFQILPFGSESGDFATKAGLDVDAGNGIRFATVYNPSNLTLGTTAITTMAVAASTPTPVYGQTITFTATVSTIAPGASTPSGTITFTVDGNPHAPIALSGGQAMLSLTLSVGSHTISAAYNPVSYFLASNAAISPSVTPAPLTITADNQSMTYGGSLPTLTVTYTGLVNNDTPATFSTMGNTPPTLSTVSASSHAGSYTITVNGAVDPNYTITFVNGTLTINPAALTITANNQTKVYGAALPTLTVSYSGFVNNDTVASLTTPPTLSTTATAASHVAGSPYSITASGAVDSDYTISYTAGSLTITPVALTITANNQLKVYGAGLPALTVSYSGFVNNDNAASLTTPPTVTTTATAGSHVAGNPYSITASGAVDSDYTISYTAGTLTITPAALTISADNQSKVYGAGVPTLTVTYSGFVNNDTAASLTTPPTVTTTATTSSHVAGNPYSITASGAVDSDYSISYTAGTLTVTPASLTITANNQTKVYGAGVPALTVSYSGFVNNDSAASLTTPPTVTTTATTSSHVAGNPYAITASGAVDSDYTISYTAGSLTITPVALTITADNQSKVYGAALPALTVSYSGFVNNDSAASLTTPPTVTTTATTSSHVAGNPYAITASGAVDSDYTISYTAGTLTITPAALTITANNQLKVYGAGLPTLTVSYSGFVNNESAANLTTPPTVTTTATQASHVVGNPYSITASGAVDSDYTISYTVGTLTITPAALTISADNQSKVYGAGVPTLTVTYSGFVNNDTAASLTTPPTVTTTATTSSHVAGNPYSITASGAVDSDYSISYTAGTLTITPAALTISADSKSMVYGGSLPTLTASYSGLVNNDTPATFSALGNTPPTLSTVAATSHVGSYPITASGAVDSDYSISYTAGTLTITPAALTITANNQSMVYGGTLPALTVSYSGLVNNDSAASLTTPPTVTTTATTSSHVAGNPYPITASGAVDSDYSISYSAGTLTITPAALTITANNQSMVYGGTLPALTVSYSGFVNNDTAASLTTPPTVTTTATTSSHVAGNPYSITASGAVDSDYSISYSAGTLTITPAALTITANNQSMVYGGTLPALTVSYSGFVNNDTAASLTTPPTVTTTATTSSHVAGNPYPITASGAVDSDYTISYTAGTLTVTPAALTITANNQSMVYGGTLPALTVSYSGFVNNDTAASLTTPPTVTTTATTSSHVGLYSITATGAVDSDYAISYVAGNLTITPAALAITANDQSMVYGSSLPTFTASYSGFVNGDSAASLTTPPTLGTTATASSHVGSYPITATGAHDPDYTISYVYGTLTITPAALTISADNQTMVYGGTLPALTASYNGFVNGDSAASLTTPPTLSTTATASSHAGTYPITASGAADADYTISYASGTLTITPAPLTITANNQTMVYGATVPTLTASYSGFVNGDTAASLTTPPTLATTGTSTSPVGTYPITASGAVDPDYAISYVAGTLTVTQAASAAAVSSSLNPSTVGQSVTFTATVTAVAPGSGTPTGTVTFMDGTNSLGMGTLSGGMATLTTSTLTAGTHSITVVYGGDGNFTGRTSAALSQAVNSSTGVPVVTGVSPNSGSTAGGTVVTITGSGFTGVTVVKFGDETAGFTFVSDAQITVTAPVDEAELVNIQVVTPRGTSVISTADQFTYLAPVVSGVSPNSGTTAGGTVITITGSNFIGVTAVHIGGFPATSFTVVSATQITATTPGHVAGTFNVRVINAGAASAASTADQFTYLAPAVSGVSPNSGSTAGGTVITITGSNFIGVTAVHIDGVAATTFTVVSPTQITATTPVHAVGTFNVHVTNAGGTSATTTADQFTYLAPAVAGVSPNVGPTLGGTVVTIIGSDFAGITAVHFGTAPATSFTVVSSTQITATAPAHALGIVSITVTNAGATSASTTADHFTYQGPIVSGVSPNSGTTAGGTVVTITGSNFLAVTAVEFGGKAATSFTVVSSTQITATAPVHAGGIVNIRVTSASITSAIVTADQFTYQTPAVTGVSPNTGSTAGGTVITITGSHFVGVTEVRFGGIAAPSFTVVSSTQITATAPIHAGGNVDVRVVNAGAASAIVTADQFTYQEPAVLGLSPNAGLTAGGTVVTIFGSQFVGVTQVRFGGTAAAHFTVVSPTQIMATAPAHAAGPVDVRVVNAGDTSDITSGTQFTYFVPAVTGITPNNGSTAGGTVVTIMGRHFTGVSKVEFGTTLATSFMVVSDAQITATAPAHAAGMVDVRVVNGGITSAATTADQFTYLPGAGPAGSGDPFASTKADLANSLAAVDGASARGRNRAAVPTTQGQLVFRVSPGAEAMTPALTRADVEDFFSAAPASSTLGWGDWVADLVATDGRPAADILAASVEVTVQE